MKTISLTASSGAEIRFAKLGFGSAPLGNLLKAMRLAAFTTIPIALSDMMEAHVVCVRRAFSAFSTR